MKKRFLKATCLLTVCLMFSSTVFTACRNFTGDSASSDISDSSTGNIPQDTEHSVWSTYSTVKVTQNVKDERYRYYDVMGAEVNIEMMKDETEGSQLIITAGSDISSFDLTISDLKDGKGNTFPKENIVAYQQKYLYCPSDYDPKNVNISTNDYVPDMLLPLETAKQYNENSVKAGNNQGITIEAETTKDTVPGTYTGTFILDLDGEKQNIPVSITVWDIEYTSARSAYQSSFLIYQNQLMHGEYEASDEVSQRYTEFLLKYNANGFTVSGKEKLTAAEIIEECESFAGDKNFNSIPIYGASPTTTYQAYSAEAEIIINFIVDAMKLSTPEKPYVEMLYMYPLAFDEVSSAHGTRWTDFLRVFEKGGPWDQTLERALERAKQTDEYQAFDADFQARVDYAILNIPSVNPIGYEEEMMGQLSSTFCPTIDRYDTEFLAQSWMQDAEATTNGELWTYTCIGPVHPYPTFHVTDYNLGTRVGGWISKQNNVTGYLYYMVNMYQCDLDTNWQYCDPYETANRLYIVPGDGYLLYPGRKYGSEYPFASTRLAAFRDSVDDYDMLTVYETLLNEQAEKYGIEINFNDYVNDLYDSLTEGSAYYTDDALIFEARKELAKRILALKGDLGAMISQNKGTATIYTKASSMKVNGEPRVGTPCGEGYKYVEVNPTDTMKTISISANGETFEYNLCATRDVIFNSATTNETSQVSVNGSYAEVSIIAERKNSDGATERFKPYVEFNVSSLENALNVQFELSNSGEEQMVMDFYLVLEDGTQLQVNTLYLSPYDSLYVRLDFDKRVFTDEVLAKAKKIKMTFDNTLGDGTATLLPDKVFTIDNIFIELNK